MLTDVTVQGWIPKLTTSSHRMWERSASAESSYQLFVLEIHITSDHRWNVNLFGLESESMEISESNMIETESCNNIENAKRELMILSNQTDKYG